MNTFIIFCDAALPWQFGLQDPATPIAEGIIRFHHDLMFILIFVVEILVINNFRPSYDWSIWQIHLWQLLL